MATSLYIRNRWSLDGLRRRPQAILWADNYGTVDESIYVNAMSGGSTTLQLAVPDGTEFTNFIILSDHNRQDLSFKKNRIENRQRMVNGSSRSYHVADKLQFSTSWQNLPSRSFNTDPNFNASGVSSIEDLKDYTMDGGAGGVDLLDWHENHNGSFWMLLAYDKYNEFETDRYDYLGQYNQLVQVYFSSFDYTVVKRGGTNHDLWNVNVSLEEV